MTEMRQTTPTFSDEQQIDGRYLLKMGALAGVIALYVSVIGMVEVFSDRELIAGVLTLGQVILVAGPVGIAYFVARKTKETAVTCKEYTVQKITAHSLED